jgi:hypothetical protein
MTTRTQQATTVDLIIQPPRVRMHLDRLAMNRPVESELNPIKDQIDRIKKEGADELPDKPVKDDEQTVKDAYKEALKEYNKFSSGTYENINTLYELCKKLKKISVIQKSQDELEQAGKKMTKKQLAELAKEQKIVADQPADGQDAEDYESLGFAEYTEGVDVTSEAEVNALLNRLLEDTPDVNLFFDRDAVSKRKTRFTDASIIGLATAIQMTVREFIEHGMEFTLKEGKRIMLPDHCVSDGLEDCSLYPLFRTLPTFRLIADRQSRRSAWERDHADWKAENKRNNRAKGNARRKNAKPKAAATPVTPFKTFEEREVEEGFAIQTETHTDNGVKEKVMWRGIDDFSKVEHNDDDDEEGDETARKFGFDFYINLLCKDVKETMFEDTEIENNADYKDIRVSTDIKRFLSNLIKEFIHRVAPQIRLYMDYKEAKTVSYNMVSTVLKSFLMDSYTPNENGEVELDEEHANLFDEMTRRRDLYAKKQKDKKNHTADVEVDADADEEVVETEEEEEVVEPEPAPKKTPRAKSDTKKKPRKSRNKK